MKRETSNPNLRIGSPARQADEWTLAASRYCATEDRRYPQAAALQVNPETRDIQDIATIEADEMLAWVKAGCP